MDTKFPGEAIQVFVRLLTHDSIKTRKMAIGFMAAALKIHRKASKKLEMSAKDMIKRMTKKDLKVGEKTKWPIDWGIREDNQWVTYRKAELPMSSESWEQTVFMEKTHHGFYCWPE